MTTPNSLSALSVTLVPPSSCYLSILGSFDSNLPKEQQLVLCRGQNKLELWRVDKNTGKMECSCSRDVYGVVRGLKSFRLTGGTRGTLVRSLRMFGKRAAVLFVFRVLVF
ncbi:hypothetical protein BT69DRAFT_15259 [Atractiella rhizophila]|nr:hypothetical protein BT69DRAFT_15259 [Atractiella rhizophila]